jgi:hypothetical protein
MKNRKRESLKLRFRASRWGRFLLFFGWCLRKLTIVHFHQRDHPCQHDHNQMSV